jgi:hypothetical protein
MIAAAAATAWSGGPPARTPGQVRQAHSVSSRAIGSTAIVLDGYAKPGSARHHKRHSAGHHQRRHYRYPWNPRRTARRMLHRFGWPKRQFRYLNWLWDRESGWRTHALNPYSGAYGIPQALPGAKMASAGWHWCCSAWVQIRWGLRYIRARYGSPKRAWYHEVGSGWYGPLRKQR